MGLITEFQNLINEHGSSSVLRERLELLKDKVAQLEEERSDLKEALADLHMENAKLRKQIKEQTEAEEFTKHRGALFKRNSSGGYDPTVHCSRCRRPLGSIGGVGNYNCKPCQIMVDFSGQDLPRILKDLPAE